MYNFFDLLYPFSSDNIFGKSKALDLFRRGMCKISSDILTFCGVQTSTNIIKARNYGAKF